MNDRPPDAGALADFPSVTIYPEETFYRIHRVVLEPEYFCNDGDCRFDPPRHSRTEFGTCYLARTPEGAFLETLGRIGPLPESAVLERGLSELAPTETLRVADLNDPTVIGRFGIAGDLSVGRDYELPQMWGHALRSAGFHGVSYIARHDPSLHERSIALFGPPGERPGAGIRKVKDEPADLRCPGRSARHGEC